MQITQETTTEAAIFSRLVEPDKSGFSISAARAILKLNFSETDKTRMRELAAKAREGSLSAAEQIEIDNYERVGALLGILWSKARRSLKARDTKPKTRTR